MKDFSEKTLVLMKPDAVQRSLIGEIITRLERVGLKIVAMKMVHADENIVEKHYLIDPNWKKNVGKKKIEAYKKAKKKLENPDEEKMGETVLDALKTFMTVGPIIAIVIEGYHAVPLVRKLVGGTEPLSSDVGTIRGDYVIDSYILADSEERAIRNLIHASSSKDDADAEIKIWFNEEELFSYSTAQEKFLSDINLDSINE